MRDYLLQHAAVVGVALTHFGHLAWAKLKTAYPYAAANGGVKGMVRTFWGGRNGSNGTHGSNAVQAPARAGDILNNQKQDQ